MSKNTTLAISREFYRYFEQREGFRIGQNNLKYLHNDFGLKPVAHHSFCEQVVDIAIEFFNTVQNRVIALESLRTQTIRQYIDNLSDNELN